MHPVIFCKCGSKKVYINGVAVCPKCEQERKTMTREQLIKNGVRNLKEFGYPDCNEENILKHSILKAFFIGMLEDNLGINKETDEVINSLIKEIS